MSENQPDQGPEHRGDQQKPDIFQVIWSVIAALFGVQSQQNRERDFNKGDPRDYITVYVVLVIALVVGMILVVNAVLDAAGK